MPRNPKKNAAKLSAKDRRRREAAQSSNADIRKEITGGGSDQHGTSPGALGLVKMQSEEARMATCSECGYGSGRHARMCSHFAGDAA